MKSIGSKFVLQIAIVITIIMIIVGIATISQQQKKFRRFLEAKTELVLHQLAIGLKNPLWNLDPAQINDLIHAYLRDPDILSVKVADTANTLYHHLGKDPVTRDVVDLAQESTQEFQYSNVFTPQAPSHVQIVFDDNVIGTAEVTFSRQFITSQVQETAILVGIILVALVIIESLVILVFVKREISTPLKTTVHMAQRIAEGELRFDSDATSVKRKSRDEIGTLLTAFQRMVTYLREMTRVATRISNGDLSYEVTSRSEQDMLGCAFQRMSAYLNEMASVATTIAEGDLRQKIQPKTEHDILGKAFYNAVTYFQETAEVAKTIAVGDLRGDIQPKTEHDVLGNAFQQMVMYIQDVAGVAEKISDGDLHVKATSRSDQDTLNNSLGKMITYIQDVANVAEKISNNDLQVEVTSRSDQDILNHSLQRMVTNLQVTRKKAENSMAEVEQQNWLKTGQAELNDTMRGEQNAATLAQNTITYLANYLQAQVGTIYLTHDEKVLHLVGSYAYTTRKGNRNEFKFGEGLVGQAALERRRIVFTNVPDDYIAITSGLGETVPRHIFVTPFLYEGEVKGVIELGTIDEFTEMQRNFIEQAAENIAIAFNSTQVREKMQTLLEETQQQAEELQAQQEELRVNNEELETQTTALRESEQKLQAQQEELRQTNEELEGQTRTLEQQQKSLQDKNFELEQARELVEEKANELELSSKYKSEFLSNMSHELRTPLNSLLILSRLLYENKDGNLTDKQIEYSRTVHAAGTELLELINEVLDLSKIEAGKMVLNTEEMNLKGFASYVGQHFLHIAEEKGLYLKIELTEDLPSSICTDRQRVEQIVKNLLSNAMKFTTSGGITIQIDHPTAGIDLSRSTLNPQQAIAISVSDTGVGIPEEKQRVIFEAFQQADGTTSRKYGGTGLGLSITRELARLLGGEIQLRSKEGEGTTFTLYLPEILTETRSIDQIANPQSESIRDTNGPLTVEEPPGFRVRPSEGIEAIRDDRHEETSPTDKFLLIIEDDPKFAKILFDLAREKGFKGLIAGDGAAGLQLADQYSPVAIILDIGLPGMDGWAVMEKLKHNPGTRHIPVHFISAQDTPLEAMKMGAIGYLTKPVTPEILNDAFNKIEETISQTIKKLLVVEDDDTMRVSMLELLSGGNVDITPAATGQEAYNLLQSERFDCMVLDLGLSDISGFELLEKIKAEATMFHLPIIVYTGKDLTKEEEMKLKQHAESIIIKGVKSPERLLDEVTLFLHRIESDLPEAQQKKLRMLHDKEIVLTDKTILMVDDDIRNVFALASVLEEKGMTIMIGENGKEALELLNNNPGIELVLMDIMMPEMDGYEATREIRKQPKFSKLPIIALTAKAMKGDRQRCIDAGANDYLSKPIDIDKLLSLLRVWLY